MSKVLIIGGGAAGMMAAVAAGKTSMTCGCMKKTIAWEENYLLLEKAAVILQMQGIWIRCLRLYSVIPNFSTAVFIRLQTIRSLNFLKDLGFGQIERGNRVFPLSDHSSDVIAGLKRKMDSLGVHICLNTEVEKVEQTDGKFQAIVLKGGQRKTGDACIVATGGISYPATGSTGDGYRFAKENGHQVTKLYPALVPMEVREWYAKELQGLSLRNVTASIYDGKKKRYEDFGEMLFTHYGVSGPLMLSASSIVGQQLSKQELRLVIDLKPALTEEQLDARVLRDFEENKNKQFKNSVDHLFPAKLKPIMLELSGIPEEKKVNEISREERQRFVHLIKHFEMTLTGLRSYKEAIITKGGVHVKEIDPGTMESKKIFGLYFVGEVLDLDALTGGFNLQIAWSTAYLAGISIP